MALHSYLSVKASGEDAPILFEEDTTRNELGGTDVSTWLECSAFEVALETGQQDPSGSRQVTGQRIWRPARFFLRLGKSTPFLFEAARMNKSIELTLHLFRTKRAPRGAIEQYFQYRIRQGRITSIRIVQPNVLDPATAKLPDQVELCVLPNVSEVESMTGGTMSVDDWASRGG